MLPVEAQATARAPASIAFDTFDEVHPGAIEVEPRLAYMDEHGLSIQIVYPNILGFAGNLVMRIEDEAHRALDVIQKTTDRHTGEIDTLCKNKEKELLEV